MTGQNQMTNITGRERERERERERGGGEGERQANRLCSAMTF